MKRIIFVIGSLDVGGAERHLFQLLPVLAQRGWSISVYCLGRRGVLADDLESRGVPVYASPLRTYTGMPGWYRIIRLAVASSKLLFLLVRRRPQIVHFFLPGAYLVGGICSYALGIRIRVMSRRSMNDYQRKRPCLAWFERQLHRTLHAALGNSEAVVSQLAGEGIHPEKLAMIYNGIDLSPFLRVRGRDIVRRELGLPNGAFVLILVANLIPYKGHADLLSALALICHQLPEPWRMLMVGRDDSIGKVLVEQAAQNGLNENVIWLGGRADVPDLLNASDLGLLCSHEEGFSNSILEAMAAALPMVVTNVGGNAEAVLHGTTGMVSPVRNPKKLAEAILSVALSPRRRAMGEAGRDRVTSKFSIAGCADQYEAIYTRLINKVSR